MAPKKLLIFWIVLSMMGGTALQVRGQACSTLGQNPSTAFPVCGSSVFTQTVVPLCSNADVPSPTCGTYPAVNPYWYRFTCYASGTLGMLISPKDQSDDYDWEIFDVTGINISEVFTNTKLPVASNWSGVTGNTGTSATASSLYECGSVGNLPASTPPPFSQMPQLIQGHTYLLLISHFSGSDQSGYDLSFTGGTADITDPLAPAIQSVIPVCDGSKILVVLNKKMQCSSVAPDGSDFSLSPAAAPIVAASGNSCSLGFDMDTITLTLASGIPYNTIYTLTVRQGTDNNTILDDCGEGIPVGASLPFTLTAPQPTPMDSLTAPGCAPSSLQLYFSKGIQCSSINSNGGDFSVTGPSPVTITGASGSCDISGLTHTIQVSFSAPIVQGGTYTITLLRSVIDQCGIPVTVGQSLNFQLKDTVSAAFTDQISEGCSYDTVQFNFQDNHGVDQWQWTFTPGGTSMLETPPPQIDSNYSTIQLRLIVSNGFCSDTSYSRINLVNAIKAAFEAPNITCPQDAILVKNNSIGSTIDSWNWDFGDGSGSTVQNPPSHLYPKTGIQTDYAVQLVIGNGMCYDTAVQQVEVLKSCYVAVPSAFTPNGDGMNDYLYPLNAYNAEGLDFKVFNRYGQLVFESHEWTQKWDGKVGGHPEPAGAYVWMLQYTDKDTGKKVFQKGTSILIR